MAEQPLQEVIQAMELMIEAEDLVAEFYRSCSEAYCDDRDFWNRLANEETVHANALRKLSQLLLKKSHEFVVGKVSPRNGNFSKTPGETITGHGSAIFSGWR